MQVVAAGVHLPTALGFGMAAVLLLVALLLLLLPWPDKGGNTPNNRLPPM